MKVELISIGFLLVMAFGFSRCNDRSILERNVTSGNAFKLYSIEFQCSKTPKQFEIDRLMAELEKVKAR